LLDAFYHFLEQIDFLALIAEVRLPSVRRVLIPVLQFVLLYLLKTLYGIASMNALPPLLCSNVALMRLIGFNAHQVGHGLTRRGDARRRLRPKRGPLSPQCLAQHSCTLGVEQLAALFNGTVRLLVARGVFQGDLTVALDRGKVLTPKTYPGRGCLSVTARPRRPRPSGACASWRHSSAGKCACSSTCARGCPWSWRCGKIQEYEGQWLLPLVRQAQENLDTAAWITMGVIDCGYLDGEDLWALDRMDLTFVIVAKDNMAVTEDARNLAVAGEGHVRERVEVIRHGARRPRRSVGYTWWAWKC